MDIAALIVWIITALGGFFLLGTWIRRGGLRQQKDGLSRLPAPVVLSHFLIAALGLVLWIVYVVTGTTALAWVDVAVLVVVALLGFTMFARWIPVRRGTIRTGAVAAGADVPAETGFPVPVVAVHGLIAVTTVVLVLLAALGIGD
jgi:hypothetical protein